MLKKCKGILRPKSVRTATKQKGIVYDATQTEWLHQENLGQEREKEMTN